MSDILDDKKVTVQQLKDRMAHFVTQREWDQFHDPKNIVMALSVEVAELMERFSWPSNQESWKTLENYREHIQQETADVLSLILAFANACSIDLSSAFENKIKINCAKYPVEKSKGKHDRNIM